MAERYLVSKDGSNRYSGQSDQRVFKTKSAAEDRVRKVKKLSGKQYHIKKIDL